MTTEERLDALERELGRTKRTNRWLLAVIGVIVVSGFTGWTVTGQQTRAATELRARTFVVEDAEGKARAELSVMTKDGSPGLVMFDPNGKRRVSLGLSLLGEPWLLMFDANEDLRTTLTVGTDGPGLLLFNANRGQGVTLGVSKNGGLLGLHDAGGKIRAVLDVQADGPSLTLADANEKMGLALSMNPRGTSLGLS